MLKPYIFFDFDGVKFDTIPAHAEYMNETYNINSVYSDYFNNPPLIDVVKKYRIDLDITDAEVWEDLTKNFHRSIKRHVNIPPFEGMCEIMPKLAEKFNLVTVTARPIDGMHVIQHMLDKHIPRCISGIHCVWKHEGNRKFTKIATKRDFILSIQGEKIAFFDDSPKEIGRVQDIIPSYLFDTKNHHAKASNIQHRTHSWEGIEKILL